MLIERSIHRYICCLTSFHISYWPPRCHLPSAKKKPTSLEQCQGTHQLLPQILWSSTYHPNSTVVDAIMQTLDECTHTRNSTSTLTVIGVSMQPLAAPSTNIVQPIAAPAPPLNPTVPTQQNNEISTQKIKYSVKGCPGFNK